MAFDAGDAAEVAKEAPSARRVAVVLFGEVQIIGRLEHLRLRLEQPALPRFGVVRENLLQLRNRLWRQLVQLRFNREQSLVANRFNRFAATGPERRILSGQTVEISLQR